VGAARTGAGSVWAAVNARNHCAAGSVAYDRRDERMDGFGMWTQAVNGMESAAVALTGVRITARVSAVGQRTVVEQVFVNREQRAIEAVYTFPLPEGAAVCGFEAITGERVLTGRIEELAEGMEKYEEAVKEGHGAFMAELWRPDVFSTRIGNLKPGQAVLVRLTYVAEVEVAERKMRLSFPTTLAPRYGTGKGMDPVEAAVESDALNPPHVLAVPYGLELAAEIDVGLALKAVGSPTHGVRVEHDGATWKVTLAGGRAEMNRNVVIEAELARAAGAAAWVEEGVEAGEKFVAVSFLPEFEEGELEAVPAREVVFVLDCSGSMEGPSIAQAKRALALCLKCLNEGDRFNICRFGSTHEFMARESAAYTQETLDRALAWLERVGANLGGTELFEPLNAVLRGAGERLREVVVLTDGQVTNEPALVKLAGSYRARARIFAFGIGPASSEFLVKGIARATGGASDFVSPGERIEEKVLRMFGRMASPRLEDIEVWWGGAEADMEPRRVAALFDGEPLRVAARVRGRLPAEVGLKARWKGQEKTWRVAVGAASAARGAGMVAACWARARLAVLELGDGTGEMSDARRRAAAVELSKRYGVLSKETTFVAVAHRSLEERTRGMPALRRVPVMLAKGWGGMDFLEEGMVRCCCKAAPASADVQFGAELAEPPTAGSSSVRGAAGGIGRRLLARVRGKMKASMSKNSIDRAMRGPSGGDAEMLAELAPDSSGGDPLQELLMKQTAEGSFDADEALVGGLVVGKPFDVAAVRREIASRSSSVKPELKRKVEATALVLRVLEECFAGQRDMWRLAAEKARRWLSKVAPEVAAWCAGGK
jgi:Ca-activated chloride channel homolog